MKFFIVCIIICFSATLQAQTFASRKLAEIAENFPQNSLPIADSIFVCPQIVQGKSLVIHYNAKKEVEHLGISLFSIQTKEMISKPVCNFIERVLLELLLQKSNDAIQNKLREYKIALVRNGSIFGTNQFNSLSRTLGDIQNPSSFGLQRDSLYKAVWTFGNEEHLKMTFPASRELIFGTDKKESDQLLGELFGTSDCIDLNFKEPITKQGRLVQIDNTDLYLKKGETFLIPEINSNSYYQRTDSTYKLAFNADYPTESLANLFVTRQIPTKLKLKITHKMYGGFTPQFMIPLERFICIFKEEFSTYSVLHHFGTEEIKLSIVLRNRNYNYCHLLQIKTTKRQIFSENGLLDAEFYTNIPLHNIKSIFN
jgi:hypothetical protein